MRSLRPIVASGIRPALITLGWAVSTSALVLAAIFDGLLLPKVLVIGGGLLPEVTSGNTTLLLAFYLGCAGVSALASMVMADLGSAVISFFISYCLASVLTYLVLALPDFLGIFPVSGALAESSLIFTFTAFFPIVLIIELFGTFLGVALSGIL